MILVPGDFTFVEWLDMSRFMFGDVSHQECVAAGLTSCLTSVLAHVSPWDVSHEVGSGGLCFF